MKKFLMMATLCLCSIALVACSEIEAPQEALETTSEVVSEQTTSEPPEEPVDENAVGTPQELVEMQSEGVQVQVPLALLAPDEDGGLTATQVENGFLESKELADGTMVYIMDVALYDGYVEALKAATTSILTEMQADTESSIRAIEYDEALTQMVVSVDQTAYESGDDFYRIEGLGVAAALYQTFSYAGLIPPEVVVHVQTSETNEIFETHVFPSAQNG